MERCLCGQFHCPTCGNAIDELAALNCLAVYSRECYNIAASKGWHDEKRNIPTALCLIHSEVSEALEAYRIGDDRNFKEEIADILIRIFDSAWEWGIDLDMEVQAKMEKNKERSYKHGGKKC